MEGAVGAAVFDVIVGVDDAEGEVLSVAEGDTEGDTEDDRAAEADDAAGLIEDDE